MHWIVQGNLDKTEGLKLLIELLVQKNIAHTLVKTIPFSDIVVDVNIDVNDYNEKNIPRLKINEKNIVTFGSYSLALAAKKFGWSPGSFINENYEFDKWLRGWGKENLLNGNAIQGKVKDIESMIPSHWNKVFSRPTEDTKSFAGQVMDVEDFKTWISRVKINTDRILDSETDIVISEVKVIHNEYRLFIVDGKFVTGSLYKLGDKVVTSEFVPSSIIDYAHKMISIWKPDRAFVLDIACTPEGNKVIEINNINSSGFYKSDISKIIDAIELMKF
jgi:hypothetical protein